MPFQPKNFQHLLGTPGFSDQLMKNHFTLYEGYVKNSNLLVEKLKALLAENKQDTPEFSELSRRFGWEFNGMRLHEYFFGAMSKTPVVIKPAVQTFLTQHFGSMDAFEKALKSTGKVRGMGWAILYYDEFSKECYSVWVNEHDVGHLAGGRIILNLDVFEHAFMLDYGLNRAAYIDAFFKAIDWNVVEQRIAGLK